MTTEALQPETNTAPAQQQGETPEAATTTWFAAEAPESEAGNKTDDAASASEAAAHSEGSAGEDDDHQDSEGSDDGKKFDKDSDSVPYKALEKRIDRFNRKLSAKDAEIAELKARVNGATNPAPQVLMREPTFAEYNDIDKFTRAHSQWSVQQALAAQQHQTKVQQVAQNYGAREAAFKAVTPDYADAIADLQEDYAHVDAPELNTYLVESDLGPQVYYHLATHRDELDRILELPAHRRLGALGKLEAKLELAKASTKTPPKVSKAPAPMTSERGSAPKTVRIDDPNLTQAQYRELRMAQRKRF